MKILLDENLPRKLKVDIGTKHEVRTVGDMGWNGKKNGELLGLMVTNGFEGFVTIDKTCSTSNILPNSGCKYSFWMLKIIG